MTTEPSDSSQTNDTSAETGTTGTSRAETPADAQQVTAGSDARKRPAAVKNALRPVRDVGAVTKRPALGLVREVSGGAATRTRILAGKAAVWVRRNPKAAAGVAAGTVAFGRALRRITRRGRR
jgi:hypothetical protein